MLGYPRDAGGSRFGYATHGEPVIGHTWAEVDIPGLGALPVELFAIALRSVSAENCPDAELRRVVEDDRLWLRTHQFGNLDNLRVTYSGSVIDLPWVAFHDATKPRGARWQPVLYDRLSFAHTMEIIE